MPKPTALNVFVSTNPLLHRVAVLGVEVSELKAFLLFRGLTKPLASAHAIGKLAAELTLEIPPSVTRVKFHELECRVARAEALLKKVKDYLDAQEFVPWSIQVRQSINDKVDNNDLIDESGCQLLQDVASDAASQLKES